MEGRWSSASTSTSTSAPLQAWHLAPDQTASASTTWPLTAASWSDVLPTSLTQHEPARTEVTTYSELTICSSHRSQQVTPDEPPQRDPYDPFFIPQSILVDSPVSPQTSSKLLQLPPEILTLIFQKVKIPYFQVSLALTCKTLARIASQKNAMSPWRGYRDKDGLFRLLERKNNWMPSSLRLCRACFRFRPRDVAFWEKELKSPEFDSMKANWYDIFSWLDHTYQQHRCPWCTILGYTAYFREGQYIEDRKVESRARIRSITVGMTPRTNSLHAENDNVQHTPMHMLSASRRTSLDFQTMTICTYASVPDKSKTVFDSAFDTSASLGTNAGSADIYEE